MSTEALIKMVVRATLQDKMLGTATADPDVYSKFIAGKAPDELKVAEELKSLEQIKQEYEDMELAGFTLFRRNPDTGELCIPDYMLKGFLKNAGDSIRVCSKGGGDISNASVTGGKGTKWGSMKSKVDRFVRVGPRWIGLGKTQPDGILERPMSVLTMQGPRTCLARSEYVDAGTVFEFTIEVYPGAPITKDMLVDMLDYGAWSGIGQWRNSGKGAFTWEEVK